ncbi:MAG: hypothetical protein K0U93_09740 [Gammaproteobacteria bacterium]|nr:hypothetical protein [Gammaproteobacteria bacterium]
MERDTDELNPHTDDLVSDIEELDEPIDASIEEDEAETMEVTERNAQRRNLDARRRIELLREEKWLANELDDWD